MVTTQGADGADLAADDGLQLHHQGGSRNHGVHHVVRVGGVAGLAVHRDVEGVDAGQGATVDVAELANGHIRMVVEAKGDVRPVQHALLHHGGGAGAEFLGWLETPGEWCRVVAAPFGSAPRPRRAGSWCGCRDRRHASSRARCWQRAARFVRRSAARPYRRGSPKLGRERRPRWCRRRRCGRRRCGAGCRGGRVRQPPRRRSALLGSRAPDGRANRGGLRPIEARSRMRRPQWWIGGRSRGSFAVQ